MDKVYVVYSFDIGDEINLDEVKKVVENEYQPVFNNIKSDIVYTRKPLEFYFKKVFIAELDREADIFIKMYDFGVISVFFRFVFENIDLEFVKKLRFKVSENAYLLKNAKEIISEVKNLLLNSITKNEFDMSHFRFWEDYFIVEINKQKEAFSDKSLIDIFYEVSQGRSLKNKSVNYYEAKAIISYDLAVFIGEEDFSDCINLAEFANVYLLELRYYDYVLDKSIDEIENILEEIKERGIKIFSFSRRTVKKINEVNSKIFEVSLDLLRNIDKVENGLKFLGDLEINNVYKKLVEQLQLNVWKDSIETKLEYLHNVSEYLGQDIKEERMDRMETTMLILEFLMILLWIWEIVMMFLEG